MIGLLALAASAQEAVGRVGELRELEHPAYVDDAGTVVGWSEVRELAALSEAPALVRRRQLGRAALKLGFAAATVAEAWGAAELARQQSLWAVPLGVQAGFTGLCEALLWARIPEDRRRDRALVLEAANRRIRTGP